MHQCTNATNNRNSYASGQRSSSGSAKHKINADGSLCNVRTYGQRTDACDYLTYYEYVVLSSYEIFSYCRYDLLVKMCATKARKQKA